MDLGRLFALEEAMIQKLSEALPLNPDDVVRGFFGMRFKKSRGEDVLFQPLQDQLFAWGPDNQLLYAAGRNRMISLKLRQDEG